MSWFKWFRNKMKYPQVSIAINARILGKCSFESNVFINSSVIIKDSSVGKYSYINYHSIINATSIGRFVSVGPNVVCGLASHPLCFLSTSPFTFLKGKFSEVDRYNQFKSVVIENDVWIGANVTILNGVHVGNGAVIGANSVVTHDIPSYAIYAGVPARLIRYRFSDSIIEKLELEKWWDADEKGMKQYIINFGIKGKTYE